MQDLGSNSRKRRNVTALIRQRFIAVALVVMSAILLAAQQPAPSHAVTKAPNSAAAPSPAVTPSSPEMKKPIARVNGVAITAFDVFEQTQRIFPYYQMHGGKVPEKYQDEIRKKAIEQLVSEELIYQDARRKGITVSSAEMQRVIKSAVVRLGSRKTYSEYATAMYGSVEEFERRLRRARVIAEYERREIELKAKVPEQKLREIYDKNPAMFMRPEMVRFQTVTINVPDNASEAQKNMARKRMDEILPQARAAKSFEEFGILAERASEDDYRVKMGDHGWRAVSEIPPALVKPIASLKAGAMSDVIETQLGFMVVRLEARNASKKLEYAEAREPIRHQMERMSGTKRWQALSQELRKKAKIEVL
jgi:peptidyl-prolyl cis-trans isomerase SurA